MYRLFRSRLSAKGFTLIELLVVIAIIGILASIISVNLSSSKARSRDAKRISDIKLIQLALETYYNDNSSFPTSLGTLAPTYIPSIPTDPKNAAVQYSYITWNSTNTQICTSNLPVGYHLGAGLEESTNSALTQDRDLAQRTPATTNCGAAADFDGRNSTTNNACTPGALGLVTETCYDVTN